MFRLALIALALMSGAARADALIGGLHNMEDMVVLPGGGWVIGSSMRDGAGHGGVLMAIDAATRTAHQAYPGGTVPPAALYGDCPGGAPPVDFAPHGISLSAPGAGPTLLYAVSHGAREAVEIFRVGTAGGGPTLGWAGCVPLPEGTRANSVSVDARGVIYVSARGSFLAGMPPVAGELPSGVLTWDKAKGWRLAAIAPSANGLLVTPDGRRLYVNSYSGRQIEEIEVAAPQRRRTLSVPFLPDNLRWGTDGAIWVAGQNVEGGKVSACFVSRTLTSCEIPFAVARVDTAAFQATCVTQFPATAAFDTATVALPVGRDLWLGAFRGQGVLVKPLATPRDCPAAP